MTIILDVSAAIQIILKKEKGERFTTYLESASWVIAPDLFTSEITNTLWKYNNAKIFSHEECQQFVDDGIKLVDDFFDSNDLWKEVLGESIKNNHSAYDLFYAILARRNDAILLTNDGPLSKLCKKMKIECSI